MDDEIQLDLYVNTMAFYLNRVHYQMIDTRKKDVLQFSVILKLRVLVLQHIVFPILTARDRINCHVLRVMLKGCKFLMLLCDTLIS